MTSGEASLLTGTLVTLRPLTLDDVPVMLAQTSMVLASAGDRVAETERLQGLVARRTTLEHDGFLTLAVEHQGTMVGDVQARAPWHGFPPGVCEIGVTLFAEVRNQGLGTEAVELLTRHLHAAGWPRVQASTAVTNQGMRRVLERSGYAVEGTLRSFAPNQHGGRDDYVLYASVQPGQS